jgi:hypothetical protein
MEALILVATLGGPTMFARIGVMRALNRGHVRDFDTSRKDTHWGKRKTGLMSSRSAGPEERIRVLRLDSPASEELRAL